MKKLTTVLACATALAAFFSCKTDSEIGSSLVQDKIEVVVDSTFTLTGQSKAIDRVQSRTIAQLLGKIDVKGYGKLSSDIVTQFMPSSKLTTLGEITADDIDSLVMHMFVTQGEFVGDSIAPMGLNVYRLTRNLPSPIYSDFDPQGYYDASAPIASRIYNISNNSLQLAGDTTYTTGVEIKVNLPIELGRELYNAYVENPANFTTPTAFADNVFKGLYISNSYGSGRLVRISSTMMTMYYHYEEDDSLMYGQGNYFAVTPEIITNNDVKFQHSPAIEQMVAQGRQVIQAPIGMEVEMRFPAPEIITSYRSANSDLSVLNTLTFSVPAIPIENDFDLQPPTYLLMVLSKEKDEFFANNNLPDNVTSFYATYDSSTGLYSFGDMRAYLADLLSKDSYDASDYTFTLTPVAATFETISSSYYYTTTSLSTLTPYMAAPVMAELLLDQAKIKLTFSTQTIEK